MWSCKNISHIQAFCYLLFFPTPPLKLKLGLQICERLLIATHLEQSNPKQEAFHKYNLILYQTLPRLLDGPGSYPFWKVISVFHGLIHLDITLAFHLRCNLHSIVNPLYNHGHFNHILVCVTQFSFITIHFNKKYHSLDSLSNSLVAQNICKVSL